jgi:phosphoribosyl 1,2-cyclic phosphodiesterase
VRTPQQISLPLALPMPRCGIGCLGSGSRGNGTLVALDGRVFLVDCGFALWDVETRLARIGVGPRDIGAILVTHEHTDHVQGAAALARRYGIDVYASAGTASALDRRGVRVRTFDARDRFEIDGVEIEPVIVPHDARQPTQFVLHGAAGRVGVLTDLGEVPDRVKRAYETCDALLIEANHCARMLWSGTYPWPLKRRIASALGHLANEQTMAALREMSIAPNAAVLIGHVSQQNNDARVLSQLFRGLRARLPRLVFATQAGSAQWFAPA